MDNHMLRPEVQDISKFWAGYLLLLVLVIMYRDPAQNVRYHFTSERRLLDFRHRQGRHICDFLFAFLYWKGVSYKRKVFALMGRKFFPFRVDPFSYTFWKGVSSKRKEFAPLWEQIRSF